MTQKRAIKILMSQGYSRNTARGFQKKYRNEITNEQISRVKEFFTERSPRKEDRNT